MNYITSFCCVITVFLAVREYYIYIIMNSAALPGVMQHAEIYYIKRYFYEMFPTLYFINDTNTWPFVFPVM